MEKDEILGKFKKIKVATYDGERALHKPFLLLLLLGRYARRQPRMVSYKDIEKELVILLTKYGPVRSAYHPEFPFWHLQNDGIWELVNVENLQAMKGHSQPGRRQLIDQNVIGGLTKEIYLAIHQNPGLLRDLVQVLVDEFIPKQYAESVLRDVGLDLINK